MQTRTKQEDWIVLQQCLDIIWPMCGPDGLHVTMPATDEYCKIVMLRWNRAMHHYFLHNNRTRQVEGDHILENLELVSYLHTCVTHGIRDYSSRNCLVRIGIDFEAHVGSQVSSHYSLDFTDFTDFFTVITICPRSLRVGLGRKRI